MTARKVPKSDPAADMAAEIVCKQSLLDCERAHLQEQLQQLSGGDDVALRFSDEQPAQPGPKKAAMAWRVRRQFNDGPLVRVCGSELTEAEAAKIKNFAQLKSAHYVELLPKRNGEAPKPRTIAPAEKEHTGPVIVVWVEDADPVAKFHASVAATSKANRVNDKRSRDAIQHADPDFYDVASRAHYQRQVGNSRKPSGAVPL